MKRSYFLYLILSIGVIILGIILARGSCLVFFDPVSIMLTYIPTILILLAVYSPGEFIGAFRNAWKGSETTRSEVMNSIVFFKTAGRLLFIMGIIGLMLGCILMLTAGWEAKKFAFGLSYALICLLYAFLTIFLVTLPFQNALEKKLNEMED
jgi:flagellar motor component MotA